LPVDQSSAALHRIEENLINITPTPILTRLERFDDRVPGLLEMFGRVPVL
jgi:hypothetical protein